MDSSRLLAKPLPEFYLNRLDSTESDYSMCLMIAVAECIKHTVVVTSYSDLMLRVRKMVEILTNTMTHTQTRKMMNDTDHATEVDAIKAAYSLIAQYILPEWGRVCPEFSGLTVEVILEQDSLVGGHYYLGYYARAPERDRASKRIEIINLGDQIILGKIPTDKRHVDITKYMCVYELKPV